MTEHIIFPIDFDVDLYRRYSDLASLSNDNLMNHFNLHGCNEGRISNKIKNRNDLIKCIPSNSNKIKCLEIGPFDCPVLLGNSVKYFDVLNKSDLIKRAITINRTHALKNIPNIDYVDENGNLKIITEKFDLVLSCHSIEHQTDFIQHLKDVYELLNSNGYYVIILPDKRYCFDHFINESTIADVINSHTVKQTNHSIKSVIEHRTLTCHNDGSRHWRNDSGLQTIDICENSLINAINEYNDAINNNKYIDVHSLQFTPSSFKKIINLLNATKYIDFKVERVYPTVYGSCEFFVILKKQK
jgi:2-polyprenyl-3-methyl-5-hydroxy-6-metoxy-1,4-benzoquinol methylase